MSKKTKQNFKIGSSKVTENQTAILKSEVKRLSDENMKQELVIYKLKAELRRLDRSEKQQLEYRINSLENENKEMREKLNLLKDGADFLSILGAPMKKFKDIKSILNIIDVKEEIK